MHGRAEVVGFQAKEQFADLGVGLGADIAPLGVERVPRPREQSPILVVDEQTAVFDRRCFGNFGMNVQVERRARPDGNVGPPVPRAYADGLRKGEKSVGGSPAVAAGDDQCFGNARERFVYRLDQIALPATGDRIGSDFALCDQSVDQRAPADRAGNDHVGVAGKLVAGRRQSLSSRDEGEVGGQKFCRFADDRRVVGIVSDDRLPVRCGEPENLLSGGLFAQPHLSLHAWTM